MTIDPEQVIVAAVASVALIAVVMFFFRKQQTINLHRRFGPEYDRIVRESEPQAEWALLEREMQAQPFPLREISAAERMAFLTAWRKLQMEFVDDPQGAVTEASLLLDRLMKARGYPDGEFHQRAAGISLHHPLVIENYRAAHQITVRHTVGEATTEDLRTAIIHFRTLFDELLQKGTSLETQQVA